MRAARSTSASGSAYSESLSFQSAIPGEGKRLVAAELREDYDLELSKKPVVEFNARM